MENGELSDRPQICDIDINFALTRLNEKTAYRLNEKGCGILISSHEILGVITEEYFEFVRAIEGGAGSKIKAELEDIAVAALVGLASIQTGQMD